MSHWLVKQEPSDFSWDQFVAARGTAWTGVRNAAARLHLLGMKVGDEVLFYHSGEEKSVVGLARVKRAAYRDPTADEERWVAVDLEPIRPLPQRIPLSAVRQEAALQDLGLVRQSRLSVMPVSPAQWKCLERLGAVQG